jgi:hypothetical protein
MNRPTFITMSTLIFTIVAYVALAQTSPVDTATAAAKPNGAGLALEIPRVQGR